MNDNAVSLNVNVNFKNHPDLFTALQVMVEEDDLDNNKFIRGLVREAWIKRQAEQNAREAKGLGVLNRKVRNGNKSIKQLKVESS